MPIVPRPPPRRIPSSREDVVSTAREFLLVMLAGPAVADLFYTHTDPEILDRVWDTALSLAEKYTDELDASNEKQRRARLGQNAGL